MAFAAIDEQGINKILLYISINACAVSTNQKQLAFDNYRQHAFWGTNESNRQYLWL